MQSVSSRKVVAMVRTDGAIAKFARREFELMLGCGQNEKQDIAEARRIIRQIGYEVRSVQVLPEGGCDHVVGTHGSRLVRASQWQQACDNMALAIAFFNNTKLAVPHPGHLVSHEFCSDCGAKVEQDIYRERILSAVAQGVGATKAPTFCRKAYDSWIADPLNVLLPAGIAPAGANTEA
ncbi:hypothetical protein [Paucibacter soli]|uniref:hypothetical protein n=1 Tax=Paucibacter soli TaxID=3133433 RepID=UPI0030A91DE0